ncbi:hypothetical protein JW998_16440 [candidate division KSB1 bacterium]|nr:hypothetical protein [candidate division KSB1 bacterium]
MKKIFFVLTMTIVVCASRHEVHWLRGSFTEALDAASTQQKPILVDFYSDT